MATSDNKWQQVIQRVTVSGQRMTTSNKKLHWVTANDSQWENEWKQQNKVK